MKKYTITLFLLLIITTAFSQERKISNLVFEGAGIRGIAYCGAVGELERQGIMPAVEKVGGTSAGAVAALCISLGYTSAEITDLLHATNFKRFNDGGYFFAGGINRVNKYFGWYRGKKLYRWLEKIIEKKTGNKDITFEELYTKGFRDLYITATVLNGQRMEVLSRFSYPHMRIKDAVRISVSIPFYFEAVFVDKEGKTFLHPKNKKNLNIMVDGGLIGNFPIHIFDSLDNKNGMTSFIANTTTVGFRIDSDKQIENDRKGKGLVDLPVSSLKEYGTAFYTLVIENLNRQSLSPEDWKRTVSISDGNIAPRIRKLSTTEISVLVENGRIATREFLKN